jgi:transcriptional regulator with PAS, ATPase and Fis domain
MVWPELRLEEVIGKGRDDLGKILKVNRTTVLCNKAPIVVNGETVGAVVTFQDVSQIQQMEATVRQRIYATGHVANLTFEDIVGTSALLARTVDMAKDFAMTQSSILILGETGTGKEVFAQSIHNYSNRRAGPFVAVNCAALPSQILESELFGYVGGAFTGASQKGKVGLFELAHGGTIFLDEIAEIDYVTQSKLLRALEEKKVRRVGSDRVLPIDVRVIAATNQRLKELVYKNKFRSDLYYRLNVLQLRLRPLRERKEDIAPLAQSFLRQLSVQTKRTFRFSASAIKTLLEHTWPGNARELRNVIERIVAVHKEEGIDGEIIRRMLEEDRRDSLEDAGVAADMDEITKALVAARGKYSETARILGISRTTLWRRMKGSTPASGRRHVRETRRS